MDLITLYLSLPQSFLQHPDGHVSRKDERGGGKPIGSALTADGRTQVSVGVWSNRQWPTCSSSVCWMIHGVDRRRSNSDVLWNYELLQLIEGKSIVEHFSLSSKPIPKYRCQQFIKRQMSLNLISSKVHQNKPTEAPVIVRSPDRVVGIVTRLRAGWSGFRIPIAATDFSPVQNVQTGSGAHSASCLTLWRLTTTIVVVPHC